MDIPHYAKHTVRRASVLAVLACAAIPTVGHATMQGSGGSATFDAVGPAGFKLQGKTSDISASEAGGSVRITVGLASLDTGIDLRNRHMREKYLEVQKYPNAVLAVERSALRLPDDGGDSSGSASGTMTLHGQTHPVTVNYKVHRTHDAYDVSGSVHVNMNDYGIQVPSYLGITVKPAVDISAKFVARDG